MTSDDSGVQYSEQRGIGVPDALQRLWTPHRMAYIQGENKPEGEASEGCPCLLYTSDAADE